MSFVLVAAFVANNVDADEHARTLCAADPQCHNLYQTGSYMMPNLSVFDQMPAALLSLGPNGTSVLLPGTVQELQDRLVVDRLIIAALSLDVKRCPYNSYWHWDPAIDKGRCQCFFDRDCSRVSLAVEHDTIHPILIIIGIATCLVVTLFVVVRIVYSPAVFDTETPHRKTQKKQ